MASILWQRYSFFLKTYPFRTMAFTTGTIMATGDSISQLVIEKRGLKHYDVIRSSRFLVLGFCVFGPALRVWYLTLERMYAGKKLAALKMMVTDQLCASPVFLSAFFTVMGVLKMETAEEIKQKFKRDFTTILIANYKVWPLAQMVNFYFMPLQHRVLFGNVISLGWNTYLAWATEKKVPAVVNKSIVVE